MTQIYCNQRRTSTNLGSVISDHFPKVKKKKRNQEFLSLKPQRSVVLKLELIQLPSVQKCICVFLSITPFKVIIRLVSIYKETKCLLWQEKKCIIFFQHWFMDTGENRAQIYHQMSYPEDILIGTANLSEQYKIHAVSQT